MIVRIPTARASDSLDWLLAVAEMEGTAPLGVREILEISRRSDNKSRAKIIIHLSHRKPAPESASWDQSERESPSSRARVVIFFISNKSIVFCPVRRFCACRRQVRGRKVPLLSSESRRSFSQWRDDNSYRDRSYAGVTLTVIYFVC